MPSRSLMPRGELVPTFPERDSLLLQPHVHPPICSINSSWVPTECVVLCWRYSKEPIKTWPLSYGSERETDIK